MCGLYIYYWLTDCRDHRQRIQNGAGERPLLLRLVIAVPTQFDGAHNHMLIVVDAFAYSATKIKQSDTTNQLLNRIVLMRWSRGNVIVVCTILTFPRIRCDLRRPHRCWSRSRGGQRAWCASRQCRRNAPLRSRPRWL